MLHGTWYMIHDTLVGARRTTHSRSVIEAIIEDNPGLDVNACRRLESHSGIVRSPIGFAAKIVLICFITVHAIKEVIQLFLVSSNTFQKAVS
jgi:hypothetical protein